MLLRITLDVCICMERFCIYSNFYIVNGTFSFNKTLSLLKSYSSAVLVVHLTSYSNH